MRDHLDLFSHTVDAATVARPNVAPGAPSWQWLEGGAHAMACLATSAALRQVLDEACREVIASRTAMNWGNGELVEAAAARRLSDPDIQARVSVETVAAIEASYPGGLPGLGRVRSLRWTWSGVGKASADFRIDVVGATTTGVCWVNHKTRTSAAGRNYWQSAGSVQGVAKVACGLSPNGRAPLNIDRLAVEWLTGRQRIRGQADLHMLISRHGPDGALTGLDSQGLLSAVVADGRGGIRLAWERQKGQGRAFDVVYCRATQTLPAGWDVNRAFGLAMLAPAQNLDQRRAQRIADGIADGHDLVRLMLEAA